MTDVADRHLRDKTDAIAYIIRNISEQCAAAVEGLDLARRADTSSTEDGEDRSETGKKRGKKPAKNLSPESVDGDYFHESQTNGSESEYGDAHSEATSSYLHPKRASNMPPTPDLVHDRSSTSMSLGSESTAATPQRQSVHSQYKTQSDIPVVPTRIVDEDDAEVAAEHVPEPVTKFSREGLRSQQEQATA